MNGSEAQTIERLAVTVDKIHRGLFGGDDDEPGVIHIVRREMLPKVRRHERTLYGEHGGEGIVRDVDKTNDFVRQAKWLGGIAITFLILEGLGSLVKLYQYVVSSGS